MIAFAERDSRFAGPVRLLLPSQYLIVWVYNERWFWKILITRSRRQHIPFRNGWAFEKTAGREDGPCTTVLDLTEREGRVFALHNFRLSKTKIRGKPS